MSSPAQTARKCNICEGDEFRIYSKKDGYSILQCQSCSLFFADPLPDEEQLKNFYGKDYFVDGIYYTNYHQEAGHRIRDYLKWIRWIERKSGIHSGKWLDVGCATGAFLKIARNLGWDTAGVDISDYSIEIAKEDDLSVVSGTSREIPPEWGTFDVISVWDTIEHMSDPYSEIQSLARRLRPGGCIAISTGNISSVAARLLGKRWWAIAPPGHLYYFSRNTLASLIQKAGLNPIAWRRFGRRISCGRALRLLWGFSAFNENKGPRIPVNAFDVITVLARLDEGSLVET